MAPQKTLWFLAFVFFTMLSCSIVEVCSQDPEQSSETTTDKPGEPASVAEAGKQTSATENVQTSDKNSTEDLPAEESSQASASAQGQTVAHSGITGDTPLGDSKAVLDAQSATETQADIVASASPTNVTEPSTGVVHAVSGEYDIVKDAMALAQISRASQLQAKRQELEAAPPVQLIRYEGAVQLANGDGDVATTGACSAEFDALCTAEILPGEGRFAECLTRKLIEQENGNMAGAVVSDQCALELAAFKQDRATNINKDISLAKQCSREANKFCSKTIYTGSGKTLSCLRQHYKKLGSRCRKEVFRSQRDGVEDYRADAKVYQYCLKDAQKLCSDIPAGGGRIQACLRENQSLLQWDCKTEVFRQEVENAGDIRLNIVLLRSCSEEQQTFCNFPEAGDARILECLVEKRYQPFFGKRCRRQVFLVLQRRSRHFSFNPQLAEACKSDIEKTCGEKPIDDPAKHDARVLNCLQDHRLDLSDPECKRQVHGNMVRRSEDIRLNYPLESACRMDRRRLCAAEKPGSARVITCLQHQHAKLDHTCSASLFDLEQKMAEDIDFQYPLKVACGAEIQVLCNQGNVVPGHARVLRCLQSHLESAAMGQECHQQVQRQTARAGTDYRLNFRLKEACSNDLVRLCPDSCKSTVNQVCGGRALQCLSSHSDEIQDRPCKEEVLYFQRMEVSDYRNDVPLAEACREDVGKYCQNIEPGGGRIIACLRQNREKLQPACRREELRQSTTAAADIRLRPKLHKLCGVEIAVFCKDVKPGSGRVMQCLQEHLGQTEFGDECGEQVGMRREAMLADFRENIPLVLACAAQIDTFCAAEKKQAHGRSEVLKCLLHKAGQGTALGDSCDAAVSQSARMALWGFRIGAALTISCDKDVQQHCKAQRHSLRVYSVGYVGKCLAGRLAAGKKLASAECQSLVLAAAPRDSRALINVKSAQQLMLDKMKVAQQKIKETAASSIVLAGSKLLDSEAKGVSMITMTGWLAVTAVAAMAIVVLLGTVVGLRRLFGKRTQQYTVITPRDGDA